MSQCERRQSTYRGPVRSVVQSQLSEHVHHEGPDACHARELLYNKIRDHQHQGASCWGAQHFLPNVKVAVRGLLVIAVRQSQITISDTSYSMHATCPAPLILDFITRTILGEQYISLSSSLCSFLHSPVTLSLLGQNTGPPENRAIFKC